LITFFFVEYIGEFEEIDDHRSGKIVIQLNGRLNKCGVISPRFNIQLEDIEQLVNNLLPSRQFGHLGKEKIFSLYYSLFFIFYFILFFNILNLISVNHKCWYYGSS
jgi:hypothetical protein